MPKMSRWIISFIGSWVIFGSLFFASHALVNTTVAYANQSIVPNQTGRSATKVYANTDDPLTSIYEKIYNLITVLAGFLAVIFLVYNGINYMMAGGDAGKTKAARANIVNIIIGIIVISAAYFIIRIAETAGNTVFNRFTS